MPAQHLTSKMTEAMERLYRAPGHSDWVNLYTGHALEHRGLATITRHTRRITGEHLAEQMITLNQNGERWCERHFAVLRRVTKLVHATPLAAA